MNIMYVNIPFMRILRNYNALYIYIKYYTIKYDTRPQGANIVLFILWRILQRSRDGVNDSSSSSLLELVRCGLLMFQFTLWLSVVAAAVTDTFCFYFQFSERFRHSCTFFRCRQCTRLVVKCNKMQCARMVFIRSTRDPCMNLDDRVQGNALMCKMWCVKYYNILYNKQTKNTCTLLKPCNNRGADFVRDRGSYMSKPCNFFF